MKRQDLILSPAETLAIIDATAYAVLCFSDLEGQPYGIPLDYVRQGDYLYFHGSQEGRKITLMKSNPRVCAVIVGEEKIIPQKFGREYKTAVVEGSIELIDEAEMKRQVMTWMVASKSPDNMEKGKIVIEKLLNRVLVYKMKMESVSGKHGL